MSNLVSKDPRLQRVALRGRAAARRRLLRRQIDREAAAILNTLDRQGFNAAFRDNPTYRSYGESGSSKYIYLEPWLREAVARFYGYGFTRLPVGARVLDLGCGSGFFLLVCRYHGLEAVGLDLDIDPLYNEQIEFFGLERVVHHIVPGDYLPRFDRPFDLVSAFMVGFCWAIGTDEPWGPLEWRGFLPALRGIVHDDGTGFLSLNRNPVTGTYLTPAACAEIESYAGFRTAIFANCVRLRAR